MPARRDMLTGHLSFLHRSWGPLEPFDNAFPETLKSRDVHSHLVTDHYHYFEDGGATYHTRYSTFEFVRGQESDPWKAMVQPPWDRLREKYHAHQLQFMDDVPKHRAHMINREFIREEKDFPSVQVFAHGLDFLDRNRDADNWLLQIETFDPHYGILTLAVRGGRFHMQPDFRAGFFSHFSDGAAESASAAIGDGVKERGFSAVWISG